MPEAKDTSAIEAARLAASGSIIKRQTERPYEYGWIDAARRSGPDTHDLNSPDPALGGVITQLREELDGVRAERSALSTEAAVLQVKLESTERANQEQLARIEHLENTCNRLTAMLANTQSSKRTRLRPVQSLKRLLRRPALWQ